MSKTSDSFKLLIAKEKLEALLKSPFTKKKKGKTPTAVSAPEINHGAQSFFSTLEQQFSALPCY